MKKIFSISSLTFFAFLISAGFTAAQKFNTVYHSKNIARANAVVQTVDGGYLTTGPTLPNLATQFVLKVNSFGDTVWLKTIDIAVGSTNGEIPNTICDLQNNEFIVGGAAGDSISKTSQAFMIWFNSFGDTIRAKKYGADTNSERCNSIRRISDNIVFAGYKYRKGKFTGDVGPCDVYIIKTDNVGNVIWEKVYGGPNSDYVESMDLTKDGGFILGGRTYNLGPFTTSYNMYLLKVDSSGSLKWEKGYGVKNKSTYGTSVVSTTDKGYALVGGVYTTSSTIEALIIKTDSSGSVKWQRQYKGPTLKAEFTSVKSLPDGNLLVSGHQSQDSLNLRYYGWALKIDASNGNVLWERKYRYFTQDSTQHYIWGSDLTNDGGAIMCGMVLDYHNNAPHGNQVWLIKTDSTGCDSVSCIPAHGIDGIHENQLSKSEIRVYPNPVNNGQLTIESGEVIQQVEIFNVLGERVFQLPVNHQPSTTNHQQTIDMNGLSEGIYFLKVNNNTIQKVIINKQ